MSEQLNDGGPAFPHSYSSPNTYQQDGMSLRDWFAGMAMQGIAASPNGDWTHSSHDVFDDSSGMSIGQIAYDYADSLLAERERKAAP